MGKKIEKSILYRNVNEYILCLLSAGKKSSYLTSESIEWLLSIRNNAAFLQQSLYNRHEANINLLIQAHTQQRFFFNIDNICTMQNNKNLVIKYIFFVWFSRERKFYLLIEVRNQRECWLYMKCIYCSESPLHHWRFKWGRWISEETVTRQWEN